MVLWTLGNYCLYSNIQKKASLAFVKANACFLIKYMHIYFLEAIFLFDRNPRFHISEKCILKNVLAVGLSSRLSHFQGSLLDAVNNLRRVLLPGYHVI